MQTYTFKLNIKKEKSTLSLFENGVVKTEKEWPEGRDTGRRLFIAIAELLKKNHLQPEQINDFTVDSEMPENYTSARIAETVKRMYVFGVASLTARTDNSY
jgi:tRNA A37 threonylcarbamoyladenosine modification protein TsaB